MRTTITLDERLMAQLKRRAAEQGTSVSKLVEQAIRLFVRTPRAPAGSRTFELVTFGAGGRFTRHNIDRTSTLLEADDVDRFAAGR
jgi:Ribbon-helix-helix protein, copG family